LFAKTKRKNTNNPIHSSSVLVCQHHQTDNVQKLTFEEQHLGQLDDFVFRRLCIKDLEPQLLDAIHFDAARGEQKDSVFHPIVRSNATQQKLTVASENCE
jgi:hypothetical protein